MPNQQWSPRAYVVASFTALALTAACTTETYDPIATTEALSTGVEEPGTSSTSNPGGTTIDPASSTSSETGATTTTNTNPTTSTTGVETSTTQTEPETGCGNGIVEDNEECDEGDDNDEHSTCIPEVCALAFCGDGHVLMDIEDPANSEECDLGDDNGPDSTCNDECHLQALAVFVTSIAVTGDLKDHDPLKQSGVAGADHICQALAEAAKIPRHNMFLAWISHDGDHPAARFTQPTEPRAYALLNGDEIAADWTDLLDGSLVQPINLTDLYYKSLSEELTDDEAGNVVLANKLVWTNTQPNGSGNGDAQSCDGWTSASDEELGRLGSTSKSDAAWTQNNIDDCGLKSRLYCFEQPVLVDDG